MIISIIDSLVPLSKEVADEWVVELIAGTYFGSGDSEDSTVCVYIGPDRPDLVVTYLFPAALRSELGLAKCLAAVISSDIEGGGRD